MDIGDTVETAQPINVGETISSELSPGTDRDWFALDVIAGKSYIFDVDVQTSIAITYVIRNDIGDVVLQRESTANEFVFTAPDSSTILFDFGLPGPSSYPANYSLSISDFEDDLGSAPETAGTLTIGNTLSGSLEVSADQDWIAVDLKRGATYFLGVSFENAEISPFNVDIRLVNENGYQRGSFDTDGTLEYTPRSDETLYVQIGELDDNFSQFAPVNYTLGIEEGLGITNQEVLAIPSEDIRNFVYNDADGIFYATTSLGTIIRYDVEEGFLLDPLVLGGDVNGLALSQDGSTLFVAQREVTYVSGDEFDGIYDARWHRIDLATSTVETITYQVSDGVRGTYDLFVDANGLLFTSNDFLGSAWTPVFSFDALSENPVELGATLTTVFRNEWRMNSNFETSFDGEYVLITELTQSEEFHIYSAAVGDTIFSGSNFQFDVPQFNFGLNAINSEVGLFSYGSTLIDFSGNVVGELTSLTGGEAVGAKEFSPDGRLIYNWYDNTLRVFETSTLEELKVFVVTADLATESGIDRIEISDDGKYLFLNSEGFNNPNDGVFVIELAPENEAPTIGESVDLGEAQTGSSLVISETDLLENATDLEGDDLFVFALNASTGNLVDNKDGTWTFTPGENDAGDVVFSYRVSDGLENTIGSAALNLVQPVSNLIEGTVGDDVLYGTDDVDTMIGNGGRDVFRGSLGDDEIIGTAGSYDELSLAGSASDYTFTENSDGTVTVTGDLIGTDTLTEIDGVWFRGSKDWARVEDLFDSSRNHIEGTAGDDILYGTDGSDVMIGNGGRDVFRGSLGDDDIIGTSGSYEELSLAGSVSDYVFRENEDGTFTVTGELIGTDTLTDIDGVWFRGAQEWFRIEDVLELRPNLIEGTIGDDVLYGTDGVDTIIGSGGRDVFRGSLGDDEIIGTAGSYDELSLAGSASDYTFTENSDGTVTVTGDLIGTDTLTEIDGVWFRGAQEWFTIADLFV